MTPIQVQDIRFIPKSQTPTFQPRNAFPAHFYTSNPNIFPQVSPPYPPNPPQKPFSSPKIPSIFAKSSAHCPKPLRIYFSAPKIVPSLSIPYLRLPNYVDKHVSAEKISPLWEILTKRDLLSLKVSSFLSVPAFPCLDTVNFAFSPCGYVASLAALSLSFPADATEVEQVSQKINIEKIILSIDDFFNRNPFFVAGVTFIWLVVIPLTEEYLKKFKYISVIDAFRKLRDMPDAQLLDIRKSQSVRYMSSPNLKILNKNVVQVEFDEGHEEWFVKEVMKNFGDPANTTICILDNFDGDSLKVAELLYNKGFKEAYAIKSGLRGKDGWQSIQEKLLPPSVHVYPRKRKGSATESKMSGQSTNEQDKGNGPILVTPNGHEDAILNSENGEASPTKVASESRVTPERPLSPYPNYPDLKPPSSPTPSKPQFNK